MPNIISAFIQYIIPALIGAFCGFLGVWLSVRVQHQKITNDDDANLRRDLMSERKQLIDEIETLKKRCDALEQANRDQVYSLQTRSDVLQQRCDALELKNHAHIKEILTLCERNQQLVEELKHFGSPLPNAGA